MPYWSCLITGSFLLISPKITVGCSSLPPPPPPPLLWETEATLEGLDIKHLGSVTSKGKYYRVLLFFVCACVWGGGTDPGWPSFTSIYLRTCTFTYWGISPHNKECSKKFTWSRQSKSSRQPRHNHCRMILHTSQKIFRMIREENVIVWFHNNRLLGWLRTGFIFRVQLQMVIPKGEPLVVTNLPRQAN